MPFPGLFFFFSFLYKALLLARILAALHYTTVAMATKGEVANGPATQHWQELLRLPGCTDAWVHGYAGAWVCRCMGALVHECMGVGAHGCMGAWAGIPPGAQHLPAHLQA